MLFDSDTPDSNTGAVFISQGLSNCVHRCVCVRVKAGQSVSQPASHRSVPRMCLHLPEACGLPSSLSG